MTASDHALTTILTFSLAWKGASTDGKRSLAPPHFDELVGVGEINDTSARIAFTRRGQRE